MGLLYQEFQRDIEDWSLEVFAEAMELVLAELERRVPEGPDRARTGPRLRDTLEVRVGRNWVEIAYLADHASYTDEGTIPHRIDGNPLLHFYWPDGFDGPGWYTFRFVNHPGTEGTHWWTETMTDQFWEDALARAAESVRF